VADDDLVRAEFDALIEANWVPPSPRPRRGRGDAGGRRRRRRADRRSLIRQRVADGRRSPRPRSPPSWAVPTAVRTRGGRSTSDDFETPTPMTVTGPVHVGPARVLRLASRNRTDVLSCPEGWSALPLELWRGPYSHSTMRQFSTPFRVHHIKAFATIRQPRVGCRCPPVHPVWAQQGSHPGLLPLATSDPRVRPMRAAPK
jgi:hypothetical protein